MKPKVYVTRRLPPPAMDLIGEVCKARVNDTDQSPSHDQLMKEVQDIDALLCCPTDRVDGEVIEAAARVRVISTFSVGFEHIDVGAATKRGIYVGYTPGVLTEATADLAFALILGAARRIGEADRYVRDRKWKGGFTPTLLLGELVWGRTLGIIGLGRIGRAVAERAKGFRMRLLYTDLKRLPPEEESVIGVEYMPLDGLLRESDYVSIHAPLSAETYHFIDERRLRTMKSTAILINTSRGPTVDQQALAKVLQEGVIGGAGIDVYETEPLEEDSPLLTLENVVLLPHIGSGTKEARSKMAELSALNLLAVLKGLPPPHWLNPEVEKVRPLSEVKMI
jgi:glyoxylate reductase